MDEFVVEALKKELGEKGFKLVEEMIGLLDSGSRTEVKTQIRKVVENAADKRI